jgi:hypothetical protein
MGFGFWVLGFDLMGDLGFEPRTNGLRVRCATVALVTHWLHILSERLNFRLYFRKINRRVVLGHDLPRPLQKHALLRG